MVLVAVTQIMWDDLHTVFTESSITCQTLISFSNKFNVIM